MPNIIDINGLPSEVCKDIKGYEGVYTISNLGNVRNTQRILKPVLVSNGYYYITLCENGGQKNFIIHRLVTKHFLDVVEGKNYVNHIDGDKSNNCVDNLEYCTCSENMQHAFSMGLKVAVNGERQGGSKLTASDVINIRKIRPNYTLRQIADMYNVSPSTIHKIVLNLAWKHIEMGVVV